MITGVEITCPRRSHVVVLDAKNVAGLRFKPLRRVLFDLQNQGATAFVAHAHPAHIMGFSMKAGELLDWDVPGFTGVELWSLMHDICNGLTPWRAPLVPPELAPLRPRPAPRHPGPLGPHDPDAPVPRHRYAR